MGADGASTNARAGAGLLATLKGLALVGVSLERATKVPYLAGIGIIPFTSPSLAVSLLMLAGYCLVMIAPIAIMTLGRQVARKAVDLWLTKNSKSTTPWVISIVAVLLAVHAVAGL